MSLGFYISVEWGINSLIYLLNAWFPLDSLINVTQLTPQNLDLLINIVRLIHSIIDYLQPMLLQIDPATLNRVLNGLLRLSHYIFLFWSNSQEALDSGQLAVGDFEAVEVYHGLVMNAATALRALTRSIEIILNNV